MSNPMTDYKITYEYLPPYGWNRFFRRWQKAEVFFITKTPGEAKRMARVPGVEQRNFKARKL